MMGRLAKAQIWQDRPRQYRTARWPRERNLMKEERGERKKKEWAVLNCCQLGIVHSDESMRIRQRGTISRESSLRSTWRSTGWVPDMDMNPRAAAPSTVWQQHMILAWDDLD